MLLGTRSGAAAICTLQFGECAGRSPGLPCSGVGGDWGLRGVWIIRLQHSILAEGLQPRAVIPPPLSSQWMWLHGGLRWGNHCALSLDAFSFFFPFFLLIWQCKQHPCRSFTLTFPWQPPGAVFLAPVAEAGEGMALSRAGTGQLQGSGVGRVGDEELHDWGLCLLRGLYPACPN